MAKAKILSALLVTIGLLFASGQAHAQQQQPKCGDPSISYTGDLTLMPEPGQTDCVIAGNVTITDGFLSIQAPFGKIQIGGDISTTANATSTGNISLTASGVIQVGGSIIVNNSAAPTGKSGSVDIKANNIQAGAPFKIGAASPNGVAGTINVDTVNGGGNEQFFFHGGVRVRNRGDIELSSPTSISAKASASKAGAIILESVEGVLDLPAGTIGVDGQPGQSAGALVLMAKTINTKDGTILSATDDGAKKLTHFVNIAAKTVSYQGSNGLTIQSNGGGTGSTGSFVYVLPELGIQILDNVTTNPGDFTWTVTYPSGTAYGGPLTWSGDPGAKLTVTANGMSNTQLLMSGYPLTFNGGETLLAARGQTNHRIDLTYTGQTTNIDALVVNTAKLTLNANANANNGTGGDIFVSIPRPVSTSPEQVLMTADGPANVSGNAGTIQFLTRGSVIIGGAARQFHLSAEGGGAGGNGGSIIVNTDGGNTLTLASSNALQASARGGNGDGGSISTTSTFMTVSGTALRVAADGKGTGKGGRISLDAPNETVNVGSGAGAVRLSAEADPSSGGDGGEISIRTNALNITSGQLSVTSGSQGSGGKILLTTFSTLSLTGSLNVNAGSAGNGSGGDIVLLAGELTLNGNQQGGGQSLSADGAGVGSGGLVAVTIEQSSQATLIAAQQQGAMSISANGGKDPQGVFHGAGGKIRLADFNTGFIISGAALDVLSGSGKDAGEILVDAGEILDISGDLRAQGSGSNGNGGTIRLTAQSSQGITFGGTGTTNILANGGLNNGTGRGGDISIVNSGTGNIEFGQAVVILASAEGTDGLAGHVVVKTGGNIDFSGTGNRIRTDGNGVSGVANIDLQAFGDLKLGQGQGEVQLLSRGNADGHQGGFINLRSTAGNVSLTAIGINVRAGLPGPTATAGNGGRIDVLAQGSVSVVGTLNASAGENGGTGGRLDLRAGASLSASGDLRAEGFGQNGHGGLITLIGNSANPLLFSNPTITNISVNGGQNGGDMGDGGRITIVNNGTGDVEFQNTAVLTASSEATVGGNAGFALIRAGGNIVFNSTDNRIVVNGHGSPEFPNINLEANGDINTGLEAAAVELIARGTNPGQKGGHISLLSRTGSIALDGSSIDVRAASNADGGKIIASAPMGSLSTTGALKASGRGTGIGGDITLSSLSLDLAPGGTIIALGGQNDGNGGQVSATAVNNIVLNGTIAVDAGGEGTGGGIFISSETGSVTVAPSSEDLSLSAIGGAAGDGGIIEVTARLNINVETGIVASAGLAGNGNGGSISIENFSSNAEAGTTVTLPSLVSASGFGTGASGAIRVHAFNQMGFHAEGAASALVSAQGHYSDERVQPAIDLSASETQSIVIGGAAGEVTLIAAATATDTNGGWIRVNNTLGNIVINGEFASVFAGPNGTAGKFEASAKQYIQVLGVLSANGNGTGDAGTIVLTTSGPIFTHDSVVEADGDDSNGGEISITAGASSDLGTSILSANGGIQGGNGGTITVSGDSHITFGDNSVVTATANSNSGNGGTILLTAGNFEDAELEFGTGQILANAGAQSGNGGNVTLRYRNSLPVPILTIQAYKLTVEANSAGGGMGGSVTAANLHTGGRLDFRGYKVSSRQGELIFNNAGGDVQVLANLATEYTDGAFIGAILATANNVEFNLVNSQESATFGDVTVDTSIGFIHVRTLGNIQTVTGSTIRGFELRVASNGGDIGNFFQPLRTAVTNLGASTELSTTPESVFHNVVILNNSEPDAVLFLTDECKAGGTFQLETNESLSVGNLAAIPGFVFLNNDRGTTQIRDDSIISATEGSVQIINDSGSGFINIGDNVTIRAFTTTSSGLLGNVSIAVGGIPQFQNNTAPAGVTVLPTANNPNAFFGTRSIEVEGNDTVEALNGRFVAFDTNGADPNHIHLGSDVFVSANGN